MGMLSDVISGAVSWLRNHAILDNPAGAPQASSGSAYQGSTSSLQNRAGGYIQSNGANPFYGAHGNNQSMLPTFVSSYQEYLATQAPPQSVINQSPQQRYPGYPAQMTPAHLMPYQGAPGSASNLSATSSSAHLIQANASNSHLTPRARNFLSNLRDLAAGVGLIILGVLGCECSEDLITAATDFGGAIAEGLKAGCEAIHRCVSEMFCNPVVGMNVSGLAMPHGQNNVIPTAAV